MASSVLSMAATRNHLFFILMLTFLLLDFSAAQIGVAFGMQSNEQPPPSEVVAIYKKNGIKRMRIYKPHAPLLNHLAGSGIELTVGVPNHHLENLTLRSNAAAWVQTNIQKHPTIKFRHVVVGNDVSPVSNEKLIKFVVPAMRSIRAALVAAGLRHVRVSTAVKMDVIDPATDYPPSQGKFLPRGKPFMESVLKFLVKTKSPLFVNVYPYRFYISGENVTLSYKLLDSDGGVETPDGHYDNLFYAMVDTVYAAVEKSGVEGVEKVEIKVSESGWPTYRAAPAAAEVFPAQSRADIVSNPGYAQEYINNLIRVVKSGTLKRPNRPIETYIYGIFNENLKSGDVSEKFYGIFNVEGKLKFPVNFK